MDIEPVEEAQEAGYPSLEAFRQNRRAFLKQIMAPAAVALLGEGTAHAATPAAEPEPRPKPRPTPKPGKKLKRGKAPKPPMPGGIRRPHEPPVGPVAKPDGKSAKSGKSAKRAAPGPACGTKDAPPTKRSKPRLGGKIRPPKAEPPPKRPKRGRTGGAPPSHHHRHKTRGTVAKPTPPTSKKQP